MICCLLALLAALPGLSLLRRSHLGHSHCTVHGGHTATGHASVGQIAIAGGLAFTVTLGLLMVGLHISGTWSHPLGPICSAIDRATLVR